MDTESPEPGHWSVMHPIGADRVKDVAEVSAGRGHLLGQGRPVERPTQRSDHVERKQRKDLGFLNIAPHARGVERNEWRAGPVADDLRESSAERVTNQGYGMPGEDLHRTFK